MDKNSYLWPDIVKRNRDKKRNQQKKRDMRIGEKLQTLLVLSLYVGITIGLYAIAAHFMGIEFQDIHLLYAALVGCVAYLPRFLMNRRRK